MNRRAAILGRRGTENKGEINFFELGPGYLEVTCRDIKGELRDKDSNGRSRVKIPCVLYTDDSELIN